MAHRPDPAGQGGVHVLPQHPAGRPLQSGGEETAEFACRQGRAARGRARRLWRPLLEDLRGTHGWKIGTRYKGSTYYAGASIGSSRFGRTIRFTWDGEARVELQIKGTDRAWNKGAFDLLNESRALIEEELGPLIWERMDDSKMSRVAVSRPSHIDSPRRGTGQVQDVDDREPQQTPCGRPSASVDVLRPYCGRQQRDW